MCCSGLSDRQGALLIKPGTVRETLPEILLEIPGFKPLIERELLLGIGNGKGSSRLGRAPQAAAPQRPATQQLRQAK